MHLSKTKGILLALLAVALTMAIFPPWHAPIGSPSGARVTVDQGYAFIGSPPFAGTVDLARLLVQWIIVFCIAVICVIADRSLSSYTHSVAVELAFVKKSIAI